MAIIQENLGQFEAALAELDRTTENARRMTRKIRGKIDPDLTQVQIDNRLAKITPFAQALQAAVTAAQDIFTATEPIAG